MSIRHIKFEESTIMRALERQAIEKGTFKNEPVIKKEASTISLEPSNNLFADLLKLSEGLRTKGFSKEAEVLENKILAYKTAETHLYQVFSETGDDLLEFAHPDKATVAPAENEYGVVEDLLEKHKKMVDVANKAATKTAAILANTEEILGLKKKAQVSKGIADSYTNINAVQSNFFQYINKLVPGQYFTNANRTLNFGQKGAVADNAIVLIRDNLGKPEAQDSGSGKMFLQFLLDANGITPQIWDMYLKGDKDWDFYKLFNKEALANVNNQLMSTLENMFYAKLRELNVGTPPENPKDRNEVKQSLFQVYNYIKGIKSLFDKYSSFNFKVLTNNNGEAENKIRMDYIPQLLSFADAIKKDLEYKLSTEGSFDVAEWNKDVQNIAAKFRNLASIAKDNPNLAKELNNFANILNAGTNKNFDFVRAEFAKVDKQFNRLSSINDLDRMAMQWENYFKTPKNATSAKINVKTAQSLFLQGPPKTLQSVPKAVEKAVAVPPKPGAASPGRSATRPARNQPARQSLEKTRPTEYKSVVLMQEFLQSLAQNLNGKIKEVAGLTDAQVRDFKFALTGTGWANDIHSRHESPVDGRWGGETSKALQVAQNILNILKSKKLIEGDTTLTTDRQYNSGRSEEEIAKAAQANMARINVALEIAKIPSPKGSSSASSIYDKVPEVKIPDDTKAISTPEANGKFAFGPDNLKSFSDLHSFLTVNGLIVNGLTENDVEKDTIGSGFMAGKWENILKWFNSRANFQKQQAPDDQNKAKYSADVAKLWNKFTTYISNLAKEQKTAVKRSQVVSPSDLDGSATGAASTGRTQDKTTPGNNSIPEGANYEFVPERSKDVLKQPIGYYIDSLFSLKKNYNQAMSNWNTYDKLLKSKVQLNVEDFESDPKFFMSQYIKPLTWEDILDLNPQINRE
jgi:hypothetical protein